MCPVHSIYVLSMLSLGHILILDLFVANLFMHSLPGMIFYFTWLQLVGIFNLKQEMQQIYYRAAMCDVICLEAIVLPGGKTMERLYGNSPRFC